MIVIIITTIIIIIMCVLVNSNNNNSNVVKKHVIVILMCSLFRLLVWLLAYAQLQSFKFEHIGTLFDWLDFVDAWRGRAQKRGARFPDSCPTVREMGGAPRNPAPRNHLLCGLSNHQAATAQMGTWQADFSLRIKHIVNARIWGLGKAIAIWSSRHSKPAARILGLAGAHMQLSLMYGFPWWSGHLKDGCHVRFGRSPFPCFAALPSRHHALALLCRRLPCCRLSQRGVSRIMFTYT